MAALPRKIASEYSWASVIMLGFDVRQREVKERVEPAAERLEDAIKVDGVCKAYRSFRCYS